MAVDHRQAKLTEDEQGEENSRGRERYVKLESGDRRHSFTITALAIVMLQKSSPSLIMAIAYDHR